MTNYDHVVIIKDRATAGSRQADEAANQKDAAKNRVTVISAVYLA
jgi:hypothetical protein